jgi:hypothetical protein
MSFLVESERDANGTGSAAQTMEQSRDVPIDA